MARFAPILLVTASLLGATPQGVRAQVVTSGQVEIVSDYRYRGVSLSADRPAVQAEVEIDTGIGFYLGGFGSWAPRASPAVELDASGGYRVSVAPGLTLDGSVAWYYYPGAQNCDYVETIAALAWEARDMNARAGLALAPRQANLREAQGLRADNRYVFVELGQTLPGAPVNFTAQAGYETGAFDGAARGGKLDWRLGIATSFQGFSLSAGYVGAVRPRAGAGERRTERGLVLALGTSF